MSTLDFLVNVKGGFTFVSSADTSDLKRQRSVFVLCFVFFGGACQRRITTPRHCRASMFHQTIQCLRGPRLTYVLLGLLVLELAFLSDGHACDRCHTRTQTHISFYLCSNLPPACVSVQLISLFHQITSPENCPTVL